MGGPPAGLDLAGDPAAVWRTVLAGWRPTPALLTEGGDATVAFAVAVRRLMAADGVVIDASASVVPCHGAGNATTHALIPLAVSQPVFHRAGDAGTAAAIARSGHEPVAVPAGALVHRARRSPGCGVVIPSSARATGRSGVLDPPDAVLALAPRCHVVLDTSGGRFDSRPVGALVDAGGVVVGALDDRLGAPGLRVGWLIARGEAVALAIESVRCESGGVA